MSKYVFKPYKPIFATLFSKERLRIVSGVSLSIVVEHVGSTAVPGLGGKGIIDIAIAVDQAKMEEVKDGLQRLGYGFHASFSTSERFFFVIDLPDEEEGIRRYHIHLTHPASKEWKELIGFRDLLLSDSDLLEEYAKLKKQAVSEAGQNGETYRKIKEPIFKRHL